MYYPYFRGKQFELIVIREQAQLMAERGIVPIIEPVRKQFSALKRALASLMAAECPFVLIGNPQCGDMVGQAQTLHTEIFEDVLDGCTLCRQGHIVKENTPESEIGTLPSNFDIAFIHDGIPDPLTRDAVGQRGSLHIFIDGSCSDLYRRHFRQAERVLIRDGFIPRRNRDYPEREHFSDLHILYGDDGSIGFGDYLMVGKPFSDSGGAAHAVAIHLTFIDPEEENDMFIKHYVSDNKTGPENPGGKFLQALTKLQMDVIGPQSPILRTTAVDKFLALYASAHFPGLGAVKKLSMEHHVQLMADFMESSDE